MTNRYLSAKEVAGLLGIAESTAYAVIREWNKELKSEGYFNQGWFHSKGILREEVLRICGSEIDEL